MALAAVTGSVLQLASGEEAYCGLRLNISLNPAGSPVTCCRGSTRIAMEMFSQGADNVFYTASL